MNSETFSHTNPDHPFLRDLFRLRRYYELFQRFMEDFTGGYIIIGGSAVNKTYLELCIKIEEILEHPKFSMLREVYQRPFDNLLSLDDVDIEWQYGRSQDCAELQSKIDEMYIRNGSKEHNFESTEILFLEEVTKFLNSYKKTKQESDSDFIERAEKHFMSTPAGSIFEDLDKKNIPRTEDKSNEFKEFYQYDKSVEYVQNPTQTNKKPKTNKQLSVLQKFARAVCSFGNDSMGGFAYLGIKNDGTIVGLEKDKQYGRFANYDDSFSNHMRSKLGDLLQDKAFITNCLQIKFRNIDDMTICIIQVLPSTQPLWLHLKHEQMFYVRGPSPRAEELDGSDQFRYIKKRFPEYM